jgi:hypothetical protein
MRCHFSQRLLWQIYPDVGGKVCGRSLRFTGDFSDTKRNVRYRLCTALCLQLRQERRFEKRQVLEPDGIPDDEVELLEADLGRPRMQTHGFADDLAPTTL